MVTSTLRLSMQQIDQSKSVLVMILFTVFFYFSFGKGRMNNPLVLVTALHKQVGCLLELFLGMPLLCSRCAYIPLYKLRIPWEFLDRYVDACYWLELVFSKMSYSGYNIHTCIMSVVAEASRDEECCFGILFKWFNKK